MNKSQKPFNVTEGNKRPRHTFTYAHYVTTCLNNKNDGRYVHLQETHQKRF